MSHASSGQPPRIAVWLIKLFASDEQVEPIQGDLLEEFSAIASNTRPAVARRWYWKQGLKTIAHLAWTGYRSAPLLIAVTTVGGFLLLQFAERLPERAIFSVLRKYPDYYQAHFHAYMFWASYGIDIGMFIAATLVGCLVAMVAKGREMIATITLAVLIAAILGVPYSVWFAVRVVRLWPAYASSVTFTQAWFFLWGYFINAFAGSIMLVVGGLIVRRIRLTVARRAPGARPA